MGGFGSGRPAGTPTTGRHFVRWAWKDCIGTKLNQLRPDAQIENQVHGPFKSTWTQGWQNREVDQTRYTLHLRADALHFIRFEHCAGVQDVRLDWLPRALGGGRWLMRCPYSGRRCWVLYKPIRHPSYGFAAPGVYKMRYSTENQDRIDRANTQLLKLRRRLGDASGDLNLNTRCLRKPHRMHWRTYERLLARAEHYEAIKEAELAVLVNRLLKLARSA